MRGINEKTLLAVRKSLAAKGLNTDVIDALISLKIRELNPWLTLDKFLKSNFEGLCWVQYANKKVTSLNYFNGRFLSTNTGHQVISNIIKVQPIHKPEPPR